MQNRMLTASRNAGFITKRFEGKLSANLQNQSFYNEFVAAAERIGQLCTKLVSLAALIREVTALTQTKANQYIDEKAPWVLAKEEGRERASEVSSVGINLFRVLMAYLKPNARASRSH
ncbi:hypothetical protein O9993_14225 [Vibrio lentus]|nr:hypothetical protein [Vibrio lentus]